MFISQTHLPQVLSPEQYTSQEQFDAEMSKLFLPGWHCVATLDELPEEGSYVTVELLGHPLILWRSGGQVHTFLNVCAHRFSTLRDAPCGRMDRLHCQYHGWEYDEHGDTKKIPDAKSFRPMERGTLGLKKFRTECLGKAVYVSLSDDSPDLEEALGPGYAIAKDLFSTERRQFLALDYEVNANWKVKVENTLESYHIALIHPETFGRTPDESICHHELDPKWTTFTTTEPPRKRIDQMLDVFVHRLAERKYDHIYKHFLYYPAVMMMKTSLVTVAETTIPLAPDRTRVLVKLFFYSGPDPNRLKSRILFRAFRAWGRKFFTKVAMEDAGIMPSVYRGLKSPEHPSEGLISIREERLFHFQEFIRQATGCETEAAAPEVEYARS